MNEGMNEQASKPQLLPAIQAPTVWPKATFLDILSWLPYMNLTLQPDAMFFWLQCFLLLESAQLHRVLFTEMTMWKQLCDRSTSWPLSKSYLNPNWWDYQSDYYYLLVNDVLNFLNYSIKAPEFTKMYMQGRFGTPCHKANEDSQHQRQLFNVNSDSILTGYRD